MSGQIYAFSTDRALDRIMPGINIQRGYGIFAMFVFVKIFEFWRNKAFQLTVLQLHMTEV